MGLSWEHFGCQVGSQILQKSISMRSILVILYYQKTCASAAATGILSNGESRKALCSMCIHSSVALHADMISLVRTMRHHHGRDLRAENHLLALGVAQHADMNSFPDVRAENGFTPRSRIGRCTVCRSELLCAFMQALLCMQI